MEHQMSNFVELWSQLALFGSYVFFGISILITVGYFLKLILIKGKSKKYDYVNKYEGKLFWYSLLSITIGIGLVINSAIESSFKTGSFFEFVIGIFMAGIISTIFGYAAYVYFKYYYPSVVEKKLKKLRFSPRFSAESGKPMRLLSETGEDDHLTKEMIAEEEEFVFDYDVWIDDETGHKIIEKYDAHLHALICSNCNFRTLKEVKENILKSPTINEEGLLVKFYKCSYCGHKENNEAIIASISEIS
jgi:hypothetical protein